MKRGEWRPNHMLNLTDPTLVPLVARYRAWVEEQNRPTREPRSTVPGEFLRSTNRHVPTFFGFLDWCVREGIEAPKGGV